jgi:hypothetical protein
MDGITAIYKLYERKSRKCGVYNYPEAKALIYVLKTPAEERERRIIPTQLPDSLSRPPAKWLQPPSDFNPNCARIRSMNGNRKSGL